MTILHESSSRPSDEPRLPEHRTRLDGQLAILASMTPGASKSLLKLLQHQVSEDPKSLQSVQDLQTDNCELGIPNSYEQLEKIVIGYAMGELESDTGATIEDDFSDVDGAA